MTDSEKRQHDIKVACLVLAAGQSRRFGSQKMQYKMPNGQTILAASLAQYSATEMPTFVMVPAGNADLYGVTELASVTPVEVADCAKGMSRSIVAGVSASADYDAWIVALGDMPYLKSQTIQTILDAITPDNIVQLTYQGRVGNPVAFGKAFKDEMLALRGDRGAKQIIRDNPNKVVKIETGDEGVLLDIDYPSAIQD